MALSIALLSDAPTPFVGLDQTLRIERVYFSVTASGNYSTGGDGLDFTKLAAITSSRPPLFVFIQSAKSGGVSAYDYAYTPGNPATQANGKMQVLQNAAGAGAFAELAAGAYPAAVSGDTIIGYADFVRF